MSALVQKQTFLRISGMSALPPKADIGTQSRNVRFVPLADSCSAAKKFLRRAFTCARWRINSLAGGNNGCRVALADAEYAAPAIGLLNDL